MLTDAGMLMCISQHAKYIHVVLYVFIYYVFASSASANAALKVEVLHKAAVSWKLSTPIHQALLSVGHSP